MVRRLVRGAVGLVLLSVAALSSAQIVLYERENFGGRAFRAGGTVPNLDDTGFNDRASSAQVRGGRWQLCDDASFRGRCVVLEGGDYPSLREMGLDERVSSIRQVGGGGGGDGRRSDRRDGPYVDRGDPRGDDRGGGARAVLFSGQNLSGKAFAIDGPGIGDLDRTGFNDRVRSLRIEGGTWVFCSDSDFRGNCQTYGPGDYPSLPSGQDRAISSGRQIQDDRGGRHRGR